MVTFLAVNESVISRNRVNRIFDYLNKRKGTTRYGFKEEQDMIIEAESSAYKIMKYSSNFFAVNFPLMVIIQPIMAVIAGESWKQLPHPWPISQENDWLFYFSFLLQFGGVALGHCVAVASIAVLTMTKPITSLFDGVILGIDRIEERAARKMTVEGLTYQESMLSCLRESIAHHQEIVDELVAVKPHLEITFFSEVTFISTIMACEAYPIIMGIVDFAGVMRGIWFLIIQVMSCCLVNYELETVANKNVEVGEALYGTPWYAMGVEYRRLVLNSMTFSQNPIWIRGMGLLGLRASRATFYSAMVNAYNVLNMMRST
ncbi:hypothetical protein GE061_012834 [Apolygus lucorum]|uniref:Odorant receptor n=1 Tax=Apolygus lucorum TaxID=248454 RepID=A0A8S9XTF3_APOLU|nr:hypothetical protein GE061_012834 [Apolygus lucorum]